MNEFTIPNKTKTFKILKAIKSSIFEIKKLRFDKTLTKIRGMGKIR